MGIVTWLVFGAITGIIANLIYPRQSSGGLGGAIILGIVGAMVGGFLGSMLLGVEITGFNFSSVVIAVIGSLLVLFLGRAIRTTA